MDPLDAPQRDVPPSRRPRRQAESRGGLWMVVGIGAVMLAGILYLHRADFGFGPGSGDVQRYDNGGATADAGLDSSMTPGGGAMPGMGARKPVDDPELQMAEPLQEERYAAPVTHVTVTEACRALRKSRSELRAELKKSQAAERKADLQDELNYVESRGTQRGCWSGGAS